MRRGQQAVTVGDRSRSRRREHGGEVGRCAGLAGVGGGAEGARFLKENLLKELLWRSLEYHSGVMCHC